MLGVTVSLSAQQQIPAAWHVNTEVKPGDLLTSMSIFLAAVTWATTWWRSRKLQRREYADRVRAAAAKAAVAVARYREVCLWMYELMQKAISDADIQFVSTGDPLKTRDILWQTLVQMRADVQLMLLNEKLEEAYVALYGYDTTVRQQYQHAIDTLHKLDVTGYGAILSAFQYVIKEVSESKPAAELVSADLGNPLRAARGQVQVSTAVAMQRVVDEFQRLMASIIDSGDRQILARTAV